MATLFLICFILLFSLSSCSEGGVMQESQTVFESGAYPFVTEHNGIYYYTMQLPGVDTIAIYSANELKDLNQSKRKVVLTSADCGMMDIYSPELHRVSDKWYIYFECDDGNTDNHQIYVLENFANNPLEGKWQLRGPIVTNSDWNFGIHPSTIVVNGRQYLLWSGWQKQRTESEEQCIFIAEMENPWTLKSERSIISKPDYEWERQWINPDGSRSAYPIFVNENPEAFLSADGKRIFVGYSASGIWTIYNTLGLLYADTDSDLLDPKSWKKTPEPSFRSADASDVFGASNISVTTSPDNQEHYLLYQIKQLNPDGQPINRVRMKKLTWDKEGFPVFGKP